MAHKIACLVVSVLIVIPSVKVSAQNGYPLPDDLPTITADNATQLTQLATIGGVLPGALVWSPDGQMLAVGTTGGAKLYDMNNPEQEPITVDGDTNVAFSEDGSRLISGGQEWDIETGRLLGEQQEILRPNNNTHHEVRVESEGDETVVNLLSRTTGETVVLHTGMAYAAVQVIFSQDETYAALVLQSTDYFIVVQLWNIAEVSLVQAMEQPLEYIGMITFFADGDLLLVYTTTDAVYGGIFDSVNVYDGRTGEQLNRPYSEYPPVIVSPDGQYLSYGGSGEVVLWTKEVSGRIRDERTTEARGWNNWQFSPDSRLLATSSNIGVSIWELSQTELPSAPIVLLEANDSIGSIQFSPDGKLLAGTSMTSPNRSIYIWDIERAATLSVVELENYAGVIAFSPDSLYIRIGGSGSDSLIWDVTTGDIVSRLPRTALLNSDWSRAAYWKSGAVQVVNVATEEQIELQPIENYLGSTAALHPATEQTVFTGIMIEGYNFRTGEHLFSLPSTDRHRILWFDDTGTRLIRLTSPNVYGLGETDSLEIWDISESQQALFTISGAGRNVQLSSNGHYLADNWQSIGEGPGGSEALWDAQTGELLARWELGDYGDNDHSFSPDSSLLATGAWDDTIALWDVAATVAQSNLVEGESLHRYVNGVARTRLRLPRSSDVQTIQFSPNGEWLATTAFYHHPEAPIEQAQTNTYLWYLPDAIEQGENEATYHLLENVEIAQFSPDNQFLLTESVGDSTLQLWELDVDSAPISRATFEGEHPAFSADGSMLITHGEDGISVWSVESLVGGNDAPLVVLEQESDPIFEMGWSANGDLIFVRRLDAVHVYGIGG